MSLTPVIFFGIKSNTEIATKAKSGDFASRIIESKKGDDNSNIFNKIINWSKLYTPFKGG